MAHLYCLFAPRLAADLGIGKQGAKKSIWTFLRLPVLVLGLCGAGYTVSLPVNQSGLRSPSHARLCASLIHIAPALFLFCRIWRGGRIGLGRRVREPWRSLRILLRRSGLYHRFPPHADRLIIDLRSGDRGTRPTW